VSIKDIFS